MHQTTFMSLGKLGKRLRCDVFLDELHPRQWRAQTEMDAGAEGQVGIRVPGGQKGVRVVEDGRIAVGGTQQRGYGLALLHGDAADPHVISRSALEELQSGVEPEHLLHTQGKLLGSW